LEVVGARGFEPPTPWSRTIWIENPNRFLGVAYDLDSRSFLRSNVPKLYRASRVEVQLPNRESPRETPADDCDLRSTSSVPGFKARSSGKRFARCCRRKRLRIIERAALLATKAKLRSGSKRHHAAYASDNVDAETVKVPGEALQWKAATLWQSFRC
jgi:hypothetical protein